MNVKNKIATLIPCAYSVSVSVFVILISFFICGCGKARTPAPAPPRTRSQLVLELFSALEAGDHKTALSKTIRLRKLEPNNVFLHQLKSIEENNIIIENVQALLDKDELDKAIFEVDEAIKKLGSNNDLLTVKQELEKLTEIKEIFETFSKSQSSTELARTAARLKTIASDYKPAEILIPLANKKLELSRMMMSWGKKRAIDDLCSDLDIMLVERMPEAAGLFAILSIEKPEHPALKEYLDYIKGYSNKKPVIFSEDNIK